MTLRDEIIDLIELQTEGDYWDFKETWYDNKASLLHDVICMANNIVNRDAYLIIGVSDSKSANGVKIIGVKDDNRKDQQHLIDFFRNKKFAGGIRPVVYLQSFPFLNDEGEKVDVDVIIIKNTLYTPFYITENFRDKDKEIRAGYIYTRIGDTNTAVDSFADIDKIEYLWKKRFGISLTVNERLLLLLNCPDDWMGDLNYGSYKYHSVHPEFQIKIEEIENQEEFQENSILRNIADHQCDKKFAVCNVKIMYHSTVVFEEILVYLDGYRHLIPFPKTETVYLDYHHDLENSLTYLYFEENTVHGKLYDCLARATNNWYYERYFDYEKSFLCFADYSDRELFNQYVKKNLSETMIKYNESLESKGHVKTADTNDYYQFGWSKANEIKARYLYMTFRGDYKSGIEDLIPNPPIAKEF